VEDRSTSADVFDLQLVDGAPSSRSRMLKGVSASSIKGGAWIKPLLADLEQPLASQLRRFLRDVGADITLGRGAMAPLTQLFSAVDPAAGSERIATAVKELEKLGPGQGRMGRAAAAKVVLSRPGLDDAGLFHFALNQVRADRDLMGTDPVLVGQALLRWRSDLLGGEMTLEDPLRAAVDAVGPIADADVLLRALATVPVALEMILPARPDLLEATAFWQMRSIDAVQAFRSVDIDQDRATAVVTAMITAGRADCSSLAVARFGIRPVIAALSASFGSHLGTADVWLRAITGDTDELAACMVDGILTTRPMLIALTTIMDPDAVPNSVGQDPWVTMLEQSRPSTDEAGEDHLAAFLFCRAMGQRSRSPGRLFFLSVQRLHEAMAVRRISDDIWRLTDRRLPWVAPWREWDRCERLRRAVVDQFIERELPPLEFGKVVDDGQLWSGFVDLAAESSRDAATSTGCATLYVGTSRLGGLSGRV
jgi:hypothetical protein